MFERYTDRARRVVVLAQEEARTLSHDDIGTEHLLLGLIREGSGIAARALTAVGVGLDETRTQVAALTGRGDPVRARDGHIPFTARTKKVFELAASEAHDLGHDYIGTEHLLLGLMREGEGAGGQLLSSAGIEFSAVRHQIRELLRGYQESYVPPGELPVASPRPTRVWAAGRRRAERGFGASRGAGTDIGSRLAAMEARLAVIEERLRDAADQ